MKTIYSFVIALIFGAIVLMANREPYPETRHYAVVQSCVSIEDFVAKVKTKANEGWKVTGGLTLLKDAEPGRICYYQAIIR